MEEQDILKLAREAGFEAALLPASQVPTDAKFRPFCEENRCGQYLRNPGADGGKDLRGKDSSGAENRLAH